MSTYRKVIQFNYGYNIYNMYLDNNNKHYFLKTNAQRTLTYITIEELLELTALFKNTPLVMNIERDNKKSKLNLIPKIIIEGSTIVLSSIVLMTAHAMYQSNQRLEQISTSSYSKELTTEDLNNYVSVSDDENKNQELILDTYLESDTLNYLFIYDMDYLDKALNYEKVTIDDIKSIIKNNNGISSQFKELLYEYCDVINIKYPNVELRVLYENVKSLEIVECTKNQLVEKSLSIDSHACYRRDENKIYVLKDYEYKKGTWDYQIIFHEFSHCLRNGIWNINGKEVKVQVEGQNFNNVITSEALNSLFAVSLFDYDEKDIAYQLQSNYHKIMIECMDNYSLNDYVNHSLSYYAKKLDEFNKQDNYATVILELIQMQYDDYHSNLINVEQSEYYPIYDYISKMYYSKYLNNEMTYQEAMYVMGTLLNNIMFDVPEDYNMGYKLSTDVYEIQTCINKNYNDESKGR